MLDRVSKAILGIGLIALLGVAQGFAQDTAKKPQAKDQGEVDIITQARAETDPVKKLAILNQWADKYPDSDFKNARTLAMANTYSQIAAGTLTKQPTADSLAAGQKAANTLLENLDTYFASSMKPEGVSDADWQKARTATELQSRVTLAWIGMQNKNYEEAEKGFTQVLQMDPTNAQVSYWLGTVVVLQKKLEKQPFALYEFARSVVVTGPTALSPQGKQAADDYLKKIYNTYHGSTEALDQLKQQASSAALPPSGFTIESAADIEKKKFANEEEYNKAHPDIALWRNIKATLATDPSYFEKIKGTEVPPPEIKIFKGKLVSQSPAVNPKELVLAVDNPAGDATLRFETPLRGKADPGTDLEFAGVVESVNKDPYMLVLTVDRAKLKGWPVSAAAPVHRRPGAKKR